VTLLDAKVGEIVIVKSFNEKNKALNESLMYNGIIPSTKIHIKKIIGWRKKHFYVSVLDTTFIIQYEIAKEINI
jgi:Fe2+ transport system protein FeoA